MNGSLKDVRSKHVNNSNVSLDKIWAIGGKTGWYYGNWLWEIRGFIDQLVGGVGLRRGRKSETATFPPLGLWGRLYWYSVIPFHALIFNGMLKKLSK